jgi:heme/copper-type cytochrome/quinol oxidase subunit 1
MFRKLNPAMWEWQTVLTIGGFALTLAVFIFFFIRALRMKKSEAERMGRLPVEDDSSDSAS